MCVVLKCLMAGLHGRCACASVHELMGCDAQSDMQAVQACQDMPHGVSVVCESMLHAAALAVLP